MGILNVTPDSFSDGGKFCRESDALFHAEQMLSDGADIIDIGGQSTRPGYKEISADEEAERVLSVVAALKKLGAVVSVDTYFSKVAEAAIAEGADLINDVWGLRRDSRMAEVIAKGGAACCLMHNGENTNANADIIKEVNRGFAESVVLAKKAGIGAEKIILDPGIGFAKTHGQNLECLANLNEFHASGFPLLLGASRKSVVGQVLDLPSGERLEGTLVTTVFAVLAGYAFVRVHDVKENARVIKMTEAIKNRT